MEENFSMEWNMEENFSMEWNMEENFSMEWNMEWKIFGMEWKWNGRKLPVWNMENRLPFHSIPCPALNNVYKRHCFTLHAKCSHCCKKC